MCGYERKFYKCDYSHWGWNLHYCRVTMHTGECCPKIYYDTKSKIEASAREMAEKGCAVCNNIENEVDEDNIPPSPI